MGRGEPRTKSSLGQVGGGEVIDVHLGTQGRLVRIEEERGDRGTGDRPDDVWWIATVPFDGFGKKCVVRGEGRDIGWDSFEALSLWMKR